MPEALKVQEGRSIDITAAAAYAAGEIIQLKDGRAGVVATDCASGDLVSVHVEGIYDITKTASMAFLNGGRVFWDHSANAAHYKRVNDRDFYVGIAVEDVLTESDTLVKVALNVQQRRDIDLLRDPYLTVPVGTQALGGFLPPRRDGGSLFFSLTATNEAQKTDAISVDGITPGSKPIAEIVFRTPNGGSGSASDFSMGLANATHASNADTITDSIFIHLDGGSTNINAECDDGTNETAATDTTADFTAGSAVANRVHCWIDCRDLSSLKFYVNGVRVNSATTFSVAAMTNTMFLLAHLEKTSGTETADLIIDEMHLRTGQQTN